MKLLQILIRGLIFIVMGFLLLLVSSMVWLWSYPTQWFGKIPLLAQVFTLILFILSEIRLLLLAILGSINFEGPTSKSKFSKNNLN